MSEGSTSKDVLSRGPLARDQAFSISVAPMMDWTDRHCRYFHRLLHPMAVLYTEMIHANAVVKGDREYLLGFDASEHPVAVQLGGNDPQLLAEAARICEDFGYDEINLNIGCPSERVQTGAFGACLMSEPERVARGVEAMKKAVSIPVTVKTRIGIDDKDSDEFLLSFISAMEGAGVDKLIVHARIAILAGLSPKQNREVPPLNYARVERMRALFPKVPMVLNGGVTAIEHIAHWSEQFDGVMIGRAAYQNPWLLAEARAWQEGQPLVERSSVINQFSSYVHKQLERGVRLQSMTRHIQGLYLGQPGARAWRRYLSEHSHLEGADADVLEQALAKVDRF